MNKPYVTHIGIRRTPITVHLGEYGDCQLDGFLQTKIQGRNVIATTKIVGKNKLYVDLDKHPEIKAVLDAENEQYEAEFVARYPGIYELVAAQNDAEYRYERLQREIESGNGILSNSTPTHDPADVAKQYPVAAAYQTICAYAENCSMSNVGFAKSAAGKWAVGQLESGADVVATRDEMIKRYQSVDTTDYGN